MTQQAGTHQRWAAGRAGCLGVLFTHFGVQHASASSPRRGAKGPPQPACCAATKPGPLASSAQAAAAGSFSTTDRAKRRAAAWGDRRSLPDLGGFFARLPSRPVPSALLPFPRGAGRRRAQSRQPQQQRAAFLRAPQRRASRRRHTCAPEPGPVLPWLAPPSPSPSQSVRLLSMAVAAPSLPPPPPGLAGLRCALLLD